MFLTITYNMFSQRLWHGLLVDKMRLGGVRMLRRRTARLVPTTAAAGTTTALRVGGVRFYHCSPPCRLTSIVDGEIVQESSAAAAATTTTTTNNNANLPLGEQAFQAEQARLERQLEACLHAYHQQAAAKTTQDWVKIKAALIQVRDAYEDLQYWEQALSCQERLEMMLDEDEDDDDETTTSDDDKDAAAQPNANHHQQLLERAHSWYRRGRYHMHMGLPMDASKYYQQALDGYNAHYGSDAWHADKGHAYMSLAGVQYAKGLHEQALQILQQESEPNFRKHNDGNSARAHPDLFKCLQHQGLVCRGMEDFAKALQLYQEARDFLLLEEMSLPDSDNLQEEHRTKLQSIELDIADMHLALDEWKQALDMYKTIWETDRTFRKRDEKGEIPLSGMDGLMLHNVGRIYAQQGEDNLATETLQDAVDMKKAWFGATHPEVAKSLQLLGAVYGRLEQKYEALHCFEHCLTIARLQAGGDDSDAAVMLALRNIALLEGKKIPRWTEEETKKES